MQETITISSSQSQQVVDITDKVAGIVSKSKIDEGICVVTSLHTSAATLINENADPQIFQDILDALNKMVEKGVWRHDAVDGNADAHIKATTLGPSETILVKNNKLVLGTWQGIMFVELDGPRPERKVAVQVQGG